MFLIGMFSEKAVLQITSRVVTSTVRKLINNVCRRERKVKQIASGSTGLVAGCCFSKGAEKSSHPSVKYTKYFSETSHGQKYVESSFQQNSEIAANTTCLKTLENNVYHDNPPEQTDVTTCLNTSKIEQDHNCFKRKSGTEIEEHGACSINEEIVKSDYFEAKVTDQNVLLKKKKRKLDKIKDLNKEPTEKRQRPNYFVAVQISNPEIHRSLQVVQNHILLEDKRLESAMNALATLHITLMVMYIGDMETHSRALKALENVYQEHENIMGKEPLNLEFKGLGHFQNRVLFAKVSMDDSYKRLSALAESVNKHFAAEAIYTTDNKSQFTPHLTIAKLNFNKKAHKQIKKIHPSLYYGYENQYFGNQRIEGIQLLSMMDKDDGGYYCGSELLFSSFAPTADHRSLSSVLEIRNKKQVIKEKIHMLTKKVLQGETD